MIRKIVIALLFLLPVIFLLPHLDQFVFQPGSQYSDIPVSHYPNGVLVQNALRKWGAVPTWSNAILSGYPFSADPLSGLHYPPGWAALLFPLPLGFNVLLVLHLLWGGVGMYLFLRLEKLSTPAALFGALIFESMPKLYGHLGAGHLTLVYAVCWTPWLLFAEGRFFSHRHFRFLLPGIFLGIITLADSRWAVYSGLLWVAYSARCWRAHFLLGRGDGRGFWKAVLAWAYSRLTNILLAILIAAPLLFPMAQFLPLSTRVEMAAEDNLTLSLPPSQLIGLVYPNIGGSAEWIVYPGAVVFTLALYLLAMPLARRRASFWLCVIAVALIVSLGSYIPFLDGLFRFPGLSLLRVPPRALLVAGFAFGAVSGHAMHSLLHALEGDEKAEKDPTNLVIFTATAFIVLLSAAALVVVRQDLPRLQFAWGGIFMLAGAIFIFLARQQKISAGMLTLCLTGVCLVDLIGVNGLSLVFAPSSRVLSESGAVVEYLLERGDTDRYRIYSPSYSLPQQVAAVNGFELADGVNPMQLAAYARFMEQASGVPSRGYSVTIPPYGTGDPAVDNQNSLPNPEKLGMLNVKYVVSAFPLEENQLVQVARFSDIWVYENRSVLPKAWVQMEGAADEKDAGAVASISHRPGRIEVKAEGPGMLTLSEIAYPGWGVTVDRAPGSLEVVEGLLIGTPIPAGSHQVVFSYRPTFFYVGMIISALAWLGLAVVFARGRVWHGRPG